MSERKRQMTIEGVLVGVQGTPTVLVKEEILEKRASGSWVDVESKRYRAEYGSADVTEAMAAYRSHWLRGFYERLARVLETNRDYILGAEGVQVMAETVEDRRLVAAIAAGATMDPETGKIPGFDD